MARQILDGHVEIQEFRDQRIVGREAGFAELALGGFVRISPAPGWNQRGDAGQVGFGEAQHLADVAHGGAAAIGDDVGGHGGAELAVALVDVLDGALALIAAGQIEIDVRPLAAFFGEKALEEQFHCDRIDRGDAERIADRAVGGRAAALHQDVVAAAELDDVPDDQEIAGEVELFDERQFAIDLAAGAAAQVGGCFG